VKFYETFGDFGFTMRCRMETLRVYGAALSPTSAWQILQGVETLPLRMERHCSNALGGAVPASHPAVAGSTTPACPTTRSTRWCGRAADAAARRACWRSA
jgi:O-acetylhomoserine (thiol)-lyase